jgi:hypothetical protein
LVVNGYWLFGAPGPFGVQQDIWFTFNVTNRTELALPFNAMGTWVEETAQYQKSLIFTDLAAGATLEHRDHISIPEPGTYNLWLAIEYSDGIGVLMSGPIMVIVQ